jgi:hypothetical protein
VSQIWSREVYEESLPGIVLSNEVNKSLIAP